MIGDATRLRPATCPLEVLDRIDRICDRFEAEWEAGRGPRIEDLLGEVPASQRPTLLRDLLAAEIAARHRRSERPDRGEYADRFPSQPGVIAAAFEAELTRDSSGDGPTPTPRPAAPPASVGRYLVVCRLTLDGGQAELYRVVHPNLAREMVLKLGCRPVAAGHEELLLEGRILAELDHPGLVRIHDLDLHDGRPYLVMDYVPGSNLRQHVGPHRAGPRRAAELAAKLARTLAYVHGRGIVHQDIKPTNILVDAAGEPRLIDFGLARLRGAWAEEGPSGGTPAFMAPEQARGEPGGPPADLFALGGVLYFLLTGRAPFAGRDRDDTWDRARRSDFDAEALRAAGAPRALERICLRAMAARPDDRYPSAAAMAQDLERYLRRPSRRAAATALAVTAILLAGALAWSLRPAPTVANRADPAPASPVPSAPIRGRINLLVVGARDGDRRRLRLQQRGAVPIRLDDEIRVEARLDRPAYLYLLWVRPDGRVVPLYPWTDGDWSRRPPRERAVASVEVPETFDDVLVVPPSPPGVEALILLARRDSPLPRRFDAELGSLPAGTPTPGAGPLAGAVWIEDGREVLFDAISGADPGRHGDDGLRRGSPVPTTRRSDDPVLRIRRLLQETVQPLADYTQAVVFPNEGSP